MESVQLKLHCSIESIVMESPTSKVVSAKTPKVVAPPFAGSEAVDPPEVVAMVTPPVAEGYDTVY